MEELPTSLQFSVDGILGASTKIIPEKTLCRSVSLALALCAAENPTGKM